MRSVSIWTEKDPEILVERRWLQLVGGYVVIVDEEPVSDERFLVLVGGYWQISDTATGTLGELFLDSGYVRIREA